MVFTELNMVCMVQLGLNLGSIWVKIGENMAYMIFFLSKLPLDDYTGLQNKGGQTSENTLLFPKVFRYAESENDIHFGPTRHVFPEIEKNLFFFKKNDISPLKSQ